MKEDILSKIVAIEKALPPKMETIGLYTGEAGKVMFYSYLSKHLGANEYDDKIENSLVNIFDTINSGNFNTTFCSGLAGIIWGIEHLKQKNLLELEDTFEEIYDSLKESALILSEQGSFDFLHGADGIVYCLLMMNAADEAFINTWLRLLHAHAHKTKEGFVWKTILNTDSDKKILNLSLSHGISSKIIVLAETVKKYPANLLARQLLEGSVNYLLQSKNPANSSCFFPAYIDEESENKASTLAWCYGDLGNAIALWRAGSLIGNKDWKNTAVEIMLFAAAGKNLETEKIADAGFCHGSVGIAHVFNRFYIETGINEFNTACLYWTKKTLEFSKEPEGIAGFEKYLVQKNEYIKEHNFLEGTTGIAMGLLGVLSQKKETIAWDACFLMN